ncbi:hypothetical protein BH11CYA1_BH11CYA1_27470 [soil metagenome]
MYTIVLCIVLFVAYWGVLRRRYNKRDASAGNGSFMQVMGSNLYSKIVILMALAALISIVASLKQPVLITTSDPAILVPQATAENGVKIFISTGWDGRASMVYGVRVRNSDGSSSLSSIAADRTVHVFEDPTLKETGTWTVTTSQRDPSSWLASWTFNSADRTVIRVELRLPK